MLLCGQLRPSQTSWTHPTVKSTLEVSLPGRENQIQLGQYEQNHHDQNQSYNRQHHQLRGFRAALVSLPHVHRLLWFLLASAAPQISGSIIKNITIPTTRPITNCAIAPPTPLKSSPPSSRSLGQPS